MRFYDSVRFIVAAVLLVGCGSAQKERTVVAFPKDWQTGEYRNCYLNGPGGVAGFDPGPERRRLPQLDCDRFVKGEIVHHTPDSQMFVVDVVFSGNHTIGPETIWTCQRSGSSLECRQ